MRKPQPMAMTNQTRTKRTKIAPLRRTLKKAFGGHLTSTPVLEIQITILEVIPETRMEL
jgi:hypothetical protein